MLIGIVLLSVVLASCSNVTGHAHFNENITALEEYLDKAEWRNLQTQAKDLKTLYKDQLWKLQLLGDEGEYEGLNESINRLLKTIEQQDVTQAKLALETVKTIIDDIYSL